MARPLLALGCLILSFGATRVLAAPEQATEPRTLEDVNHALSGRRADIVLAAGGSAARVSKVVVSKDSVSWRADGKSVSVPVSEVTRITTHPKSRLLRSIGIGAGIGAFGGALIGSADASGNNDGFEHLETGVSTAAGSLTGALVGAVISAMRGRLPAAVVFEAPVDRYAAAPSSADEERSRYLVSLLHSQRPE
jgi:hypothetical protein